MESVGIRELKNRLTYYLRIVRQGRTIVVTERGTPVARLVPITPQGKTSMPPDLEERLWDLAAEGVLHWSGEAFQLPRLVAVNRESKLLSDLVVEDRQ